MLIAGQREMMVVVQPVRAAQEEEEGADGRGPHVSGRGGKRHARKAQTKEGSIFS
jgi:hypothetical protein